MNKKMLTKSDRNNNRYAVWAWEANKKLLYLAQIILCCCKAYDTWHDLAVMWIEYTRHSASQKKHYYHMKV